MSGTGTNRRDFLALSAGAGAAATLAGGAAFAQVPAAPQNTPILKAAPITKAERNARLGRAQALMRAQGVAAMLVEGGSTLEYFTGVKWGRSERLTAALLPAEGPICMVTPGFEEPRVVEMLQVPGDVRVWQEDEDPRWSSPAGSRTRSSPAARSRSRKPCATSRCSGCRRRCRA